MASGTTYQALKRLTWLPERDADDNGTVIAGQQYNDVYFTGGVAENLTLINCSGGTSVSIFKLVPTGTTVTVVGGTMVAFNSSTSSPKTVNIPTSQGSLAVVVVSDFKGDANSNPITIVPATGAIVGGLNQVNSSWASGTWIDTPLGWSQI